MSLLGKKDKRGSEKPVPKDDKKRAVSVSAGKEAVPPPIAAATAADRKSRDDDSNDSAPEKKTALTVEKKEKDRRGTEGDGSHAGPVKYTGEIPPPRPADFPYTINDLPADVKKILDNKALNFDRALVEKHFNHFWNIARFLLRESFPSDSRDVVDKFRKQFSVKSRPYATPSQIESAKKAIITPEKPLKKLYKGNEKAGSGGFGEVFVAKDQTSKSGKDRVAIKRIGHTTTREMENNYTEIAFLNTVKHPNIVEFKKAFLHKDEKKKEPDEVWVVMEYLEGGTLGEAAAANALSEDHIAFVAHEILAALKYLHEKQFVHRDLKSANVMMSIKGEIKLIDFGLCADFSEGPRLQMLGSPYWIPPEMSWQIPHSFPADVWSMAVCLLELMLTHPPHHDSNVKGMFYVATKGLTDQIPSTASVAAKGFLARCLILDPEKRPPVTDLLKDPWVSRPNLNKGIEEVLKQVFLSASFQTLGF